MQSFIPVTRQKRRSRHNPVLDNMLIVSGYERLSWPEQVGAQRYYAVVGVPRLGVLGSRWNFRYSAVRTGYRLSHLEAVDVIILSSPEFELALPCDHVSEKSKQESPPINWCGCAKRDTTHRH